jgi:uncharacterized membrane protein
MADDFRDDPEYQKTRNGIVGSKMRSAAWGAVTGIGAVTTAALMLGDIVPFVQFLTIPLTVVAGAATVYAGYKSWQANKDGDMAQAEVNAQRNAYYIKKTLQEERAASIAQNYGQQDGAATNWRAQTEASKGVAAQGRS